MFAPLTVSQLVAYITAFSLHKIVIANISEHFPGFKNNPFQLLYATLHIHINMLLVNEQF